jgi:membrane-bound serine protease (ClpP class)
MKLTYILLALFFLLTGATAYAAGMAEKQVQAGPGDVVVLSVNGPIGPALYNYMQKGFAVAERSRAGLIVLELNTPGGLLTTTREMATLILNSPIPVAVQVTPSGAHAASAGTFIVYASHVAAMADGTNIGAATPIQMGPSMPGKDEKEEKSKDKKEQPGTN